MPLGEAAEPSPSYLGRPREEKAGGGRASSLQGEETAMHFQWAWPTALWWEPGVLRPCPQAWASEAVLSLHFPASLGKLGPES